MPVIPGQQALSPTVQSIANQLKANPEFYNVLGGASGYSTEPLLTLCNEVLCRILDEGMPWKWNRRVFPSFLTVSLQQDYVTNITDLSWLENAWLIDINNSTSNSNGAPKPIRPMEVVRDLVQTSVQNVPFQLSFAYNNQAYMGAWQANTVYGCGYGVAQLPKSPIQQFLDENGNILFIDSTQLGLTIESPGYTGTTIPLPPFSPYGVSGSIQPAADPNATPGSTVADGTVIWTVADPWGYCLRLNPLPALNGLTWLITGQYQILPPVLQTLQQRIDPIPFSMAYLFRQGLRAALKSFNGSPNAAQEYAEWEEVLVKSVRAADRQQENNVLTPTNTILGGNGMPYGPAFYNPGYGN
jgi:hypothetical protein